MIDGFQTHILSKHPLCNTVAPYIDRKNLQKKTVASGQTLKFEAAVKGEPAPTIVWTLKGEPINNNRLKIDNEEHLTSFTLQKSRRKDTGLYTVTATNDSGTDTVEVEIEVLGKRNVWIKSGLIYFNLLKLNLNNYLRLIQ